MSETPSHSLEFIRGQSTLLAGSQSQLQQDEHSHERLRHAKKRRPRHDFLLPLRRAVASTLDLPYTTSTPQQASQRELYTILSAY